MQTRKAKQQGEKKTRGVRKKKKKKKKKRQQQQQQQTTNRIFQNNFPLLLKVKVRRDRFKVEKWRFENTKSKLTVSLF
jgi:hypothetical protein